MSNNEQALFGKDDGSTTAASVSWIDAGRPPQLGTVKWNPRSLNDDVLVEYPQSGERIRGRHTIQAVRSHHPAKLGFTIRRIQGLGDLWITEYVLSSHEQPTQTVSILEFCDGNVAHETHSFADPFEPPAWRAQWVEQQEQ